MTADRKNTPTPGFVNQWGPTALFVGGPNGGTVSDCGSPRADRMVRYRAVQISDDDFHEACANADLLGIGWNLLKAMVGPNATVEEYRAYANHLAGIDTMPTPPNPKPDTKGTKA